MPAPLPTLTELPARATRALWPGPAAPIEFAFDVPAPDVGRRGLAVIAHPHPLFGGTMDNKVVTSAERALRELGLETLRFNFRGVGQSGGVHDEGRGESADLIALAHWLQAQRGPGALWLAGFSFGSYVAARAAASLPVAQMISIAPPVERCPFAQLPPANWPWLIVQGENDEVVAPQAVYDFAAARQPPPTLLRLADTGHFFHGKLVELRGLIQRGVQPPLALMPT